MTKKYKSIIGNGMRIMNEMEYELKPFEEGDEEYIDNKCEEYNYSVVTPKEGELEEEMVLKITDEEGTMIAGCIVGYYKWKIAYLNVLWVDEPYRRKGLGSVLIREFERIARQKNCYVSILYTCDFQAKPLYMKHGYTIAGTDENWPQGHELYAFVKRLDRPAEEYIPRTDREYDVISGDAADKERILKGITDYNNALIPLICTEVTLNRKITDDAGKLIAGCEENVDDWGGGFIQLWVEEPYRNKGIGSFLLDQAEKQARENGAYVMMIYIFDWQAEFFRKRGYTAWMRVEDFPKGHTYYAMKKEF